MPGLYDPKEYWRLRQEPNRFDQLTKVEHDWIDHSVEDGDTILDIGPGTGRCFPAFVKSSQVYGLDIVRTYSKRSEASAKALGLNYIFNKVDDPSNALEIVGGYNVGVAVKMLQHVPPDVVSGWIQVLSYANTLVVIGDTVTGEPAKHMFNHDYRSLIDDVGFIIDYKEIELNKTETRIFLRAKSRRENE